METTNIANKIAQQKLQAFLEKRKGYENGNNIANLIWKPSEGVNVIRMVPYVYDPNFPLQELYFHYNIGNFKLLLSPKSYGEADPFEEYATKLRYEGKKEDAKKFSARMRIYVPIVVRGRETEGVKFWGFGSEVYKQLLEIMADNEYGIIYDLRNGRDLKVSFKKGSTPMEYSTSVLPSSKESPVSADPEIKNKISDQKRLIGEVFKRYTYDELAEIMKEWINNGMSDGSSDTSFNPPKNSQDDVKKENVDKAVDKFADLW